MQNNNNIKKVIPEPLLFIHTVSTPIMSNGSQRYYDSRDPEKSKSKEKAELIIGKEENKKSEIRKAKKIDELLLKKIQNIVQMYKLELKKKGKIIKSVDDWNILFQLSLKPIIMNHMKEYHLK